MHGLIDLHCHLLPGVDDGPREAREAAELVCELEAIGFSEIYPTPHHKAGVYAPSLEESELAATRLREALVGSGSKVVVHPPSGENTWDELFLERQKGSGSFPTYPGGEAFLIEFSVQGPPPHLRDLLFQFRLGGRLPVIAHVERYPTLCGDLQRFEELAQGAAMTVNLSSLAAWWSGRTARRLVRAGLVHAVATDCHNLVDIEACRKGINWLLASMGEGAISDLLVDNPKRILQGELPGP